MSEEATRCGFVCRCPKRARSARLPSSMSNRLARILVVDDEPQIRRFLRLGLEGHGYAVLEATTAEAALRVAVAEQPELVVLDLVHPLP